METIIFNKLLLKTAFSCMACDGDIDPREIKLIAQLHSKKKLFGEIDIDIELDKLRKSINENGKLFIKDYFNELSSTQLNESNELKLIEVAIDTIKADDKIEYSEIKFFKVIRSKLKIDNESILSKHPDFEDYLEQDIISGSYLLKLQDDFFENNTLPKFELKNSIDDSMLKGLIEDGD
jgi:uncharacterized tellurite resistance protein B-like protein